MSKVFIKYLTELWEFMEHHNNFAPFPPYDTDYVKDVKKLIKKMEKSTEDYDNLPVVACAYCNSLHIEVDDTENDLCMRCGAINDIKIYKNIEEYLKEIGHDSD